MKIQGNTVTNYQKINETGTFTQGDFLKVLVAQLKYQDPLSPTNDKEFMAQMAQFSSLEQMVNLNNNFSKMYYLLGIGFDSVNAFNLVGKYVEIQTGDQIISGLVDKVLQKKGEFFVEVNSKEYKLTEIISVSRGDENVKDN
ncbi:flagellar basal-body rod modification protein FlgD [Anaerobranca californiensis DSM 14826]|jgi:flagellar basal-body rod modification protein FlgD|uniref:Flagellar basal-body rod modification protein FlgD n=1 Tax=Anaerobranca californiensis DSM 14826 TaxID=1120989 RepID=A0A1M6KIZ9_9FIRM|nr:flagellar hook capping FlgD N-terminal domain-containing protein [Anaerobranca californiensis]SHJ58903.1 flagellar basal-body rod modification protein FlgD [Anaerobranca californiensis DSM 14826]